MKRVLLLFLMTITTIAGSVVAKVQTPTADDPSFLKLS